jgi:hypothetical protein
VVRLMRGVVGGVISGVGRCELLLQGQRVLLPAFVRKRSLYSAMKAWRVRSWRPLLKALLVLWLCEFIPYLSFALVSIALR